VEPRTHRRRRDGGGLVLGGILVLVGVYYLLQQTLGFDLPDLDWDKLWPVILIAIGGLVLYGAWRRRNEA
jgi:hypothetical protein